VFTPVLGEWGVMFKGGGHFFFSDYHFCRAVMMREGSICENVFNVFWLVCLEVAISLRVMRPMSSDANPFT
jgi:hypothetical protein